MFRNFSSNFNSDDIAWLSSLQTLLTNLNFHIAKYSSVISLPYLFHSLVYQTLYHFKLRGIKEFSNGPMESRRERDETIQQWTNFNGAIGKSNADGLTAENLIAKDPSADLPEPSKFVETPICCWVKRTLATLYKK